MNTMQARKIYWRRFNRWSDRIAWRLGFVRYVRPAPPPPIICPVGDPKEVSAIVADFAEQSTAGQVMRMDTCGADNRYLDIHIRFKAPKP